MAGILNAAAKATIEGFVGSNSSEKRRDAYVEFLAVLLTFLLAFVILGFVGKYLWNNVVVDLFTFAKPARSLWQIIGLMFFMSLVRH